MPENWKLQAAKTWLFFLIFLILSVSLKQQVFLWAGPILKHDSPWAGA